MRIYRDDLFEPVSLGNIQRQPEAFVFKQGSSAPIWIGFHINHGGSHVRLVTPARIASEFERVHANGLGWI